MVIKPSPWFKMVQKWNRWSGRMMELGQHWIVEPMRLQLVVLRANGLQEVKMVGLESWALAQTILPLVHSCGQTVHQTSFH